jgi:RNA polymerase sigma-70 factor (ECF subfamily)
MVFQAHQGEADAARAAQQALLQRYSGAIYRYLLGALRDPDAADEVFQDFALKFVRGYFRRADPGHGRFRDFVKTALSNQIKDYRHKKLGSPLKLPEGIEPAASGHDPAASDQEFLDRWREELLERTWEALEQVQKQTGQTVYAVLRFRADHPQLASTEMAEQLSAQLGKPLSASGVRQSLHRARERFAELLLDEVARSLQTTDLERLEQELIDLGLQAYCRSALDQRRRNT